MDWQVIRRFTMLSLLIGFTLCATVATANAQLRNPIRAVIPFDFSVGNKKLPAGEYTFGRLSGISDTRMMFVSNEDSSQRMFQSTYGTQVRVPKKASILVFHKYGDQYFLKQIWTSGEQDGTQLPESRSERAAQQQLSRTQQKDMSGNVIRVETVEVSASLF